MLQSILCMLEIFRNRICFQKYTVKGSTDILEKFCEREDERKMAYIEINSPASN